MYQFFSETECDLLVDNTTDWELYKTKDFEYFQKIINYEWVNEKLLSKIEIQKNIKLNSKFISRIIKLQTGHKLRTHSFNYMNSNSLYKNTTFSINIFLNDNFKGGDYYFNNHLHQTKKGFGVIHDLDTTQRVKEIEENDCYLLFTHFNTIISNKLI